MLLRGVKAIQKQYFLKCSQFKPISLSEYFKNLFECMMFFFNVQDDILRDVVVEALVEELGN